ncbi:hypothetical protein SRB5_58450 [Streptomyces sp. RB5]|uniref:Peptidoglycan binding-like domain-containing protein n=1 Tax=Streptomyces smaragdinus TaxID=2585196 RepID=A0A7K0CQA2_9ACTN|nr:peptidoglycan-binding domain-containing protein [Streptomyces smaragdinus]MQY15657.1 hypothetical protein [Streptomyces smaragdinus]
MKNVLKRVAVTTVSAALLAGGAVAIAPTAQAKGRCTYVSDSYRPTLRPGATGNAVKQMQCLINSFSAYPVWLTEDGSYGPKTKLAVAYVQSCNGTAGGVDYVVGPSTWNALYNPKYLCAL